MLSNRRLSTLSDPYFEDVETFCSARRCQVTLSLRTSKRPKGNTITGVSQSCNYEAGCSKGVLCLLKANRITTARRKS